MTLERIACSFANQKKYDYLENPSFQALTGKKAFHIM